MIGYSAPRWPTRWTSMRLWSPPETWAENDMPRRDPTANGHRQPRLVRPRRRRGCEASAERAVEGRVRTRGCPDPLVSAQVLIHEDPHVAPEPEGVDACWSRKPVSSRTSRGVAGRIATSPVTAASNAYGPTDEADDRDQPALGPRGHEDEGLDDLTELGIDGRGGLDVR